MITNEQKKNYNKFTKENTNTFNNKKDFSQNKAFTNPTQNTSVIIHAIIALSSKKSRPTTPIFCGISIGITAKHKPKINEIIINLILGLKRLLFKSSIKPIHIQENIASQKAIDIVESGLGSITPE